MIAAGVNAKTLSTFMGHATARSAGAGAQLAHEVQKPLV
jgi:hypothetical protein